MFRTFGVSEPRGLSSDMLESPLAAIGAGAPDPQGDDNKVRASTSFGGLRYWSRSLSGHLWKDWKSWPHINLINDQGSGDRTGVYAVSYFPPVQLNCTA